MPFESPDRARNRRLRVRRMLVERRPGQDRGAGDSAARRDSGRVRRDRCRTGRDRCAGGPDPGAGAGASSASWPCWSRTRSASPASGPSPTPAFSPSRGRCSTCCSRLSPRSHGRYCESWLPDWSRHAPGTSGICLRRIPVAGQQLFGPRACRVRISGPGSRFVSVVSRTILLCRSPASPRTLSRCSGR